MPFRVVVELNYIFHCIILCIDKYEYGHAMLSCYGDITSLSGEECDDLHFILSSIVIMTLR